VLSGQLTSGELARLAVQRHEDWHSKPEYFFDNATAEKVMKIFSLFRHTSGEYGGKPFGMLPWQSWAIAQIFAWKHRASGKRIIRKVYIEVAKKNSQTVAKKYDDIISILIRYEKAGLLREDMASEISQVMSGKKAKKEIENKTGIPDDVFDFIIIDLPPTVDLPALNCLLACDYILTPVEYSELAKAGLLNLLSNFGQIKKHNTKLQFLGCFGCKVNNSFKNTKVFREFYQEYPDLFFSSEIGQNQSIANLPTLHKNLYQVGDKTAQEDYQALSEEILSKIIKSKIK
jgi:cellulose biosynthesis protein BcsQ